MSAYAQTYQFSPCSVCGLRKPCVTDRGYWAGDIWIDVEFQCEECASKHSPCPVTTCDECQQAIADGELTVEPERRSA